MASSFATKISVFGGNNCAGSGSSTSETNLKDETLTKLTHMTWKRSRQPSECSVGNSSPEKLKSPNKSIEASNERKSERDQRHCLPEKYVSNSNNFPFERGATIEGSRGDVQISSSNVTVYQARPTMHATGKIHVPAIPPEEFNECVSEEDSSSEMPEGDALDRNLIVERRKNLVKSISKIFFRYIRPNCENFDKFYYVDETSLRKAFDKTFGHHRRVKKKTDNNQSVVFNVQSAAPTKTSSSLNVQAPPFWPQPKNSSSKELDDVHYDAKIDSHIKKPISTALAPAVSPSTVIPIDSPVLTQSVKKGIHKRGYILNRRPLSENCAHIDDSLHANRLDSQAQRQEYLRATLNELDALRLNNLSYFQSDCENTPTSFVESCKTDYNNLVPITASSQSIAVKSTVSDTFDSISDCKTSNLTSTANLNSATGSSYIPTLSMTCVSSACISSATPLTTGNSLTNSWCQSKPIVAAYSTFGTETNPKVMVSEYASGTTVTTVPNEIVCQSWPQLNRTRPYSHDNSESNNHFLSPVVQSGVHDTNFSSFRSTKNQCSSNYESNAMLPSNSASPPPSHASNSRAGACQSQMKDMYLSSRNEIVLDSKPNLNVHGVRENENRDTSVVGMGQSYSLQCGRKDCTESTQKQPQRAVDTLISNLPAAISKGATFSDPLQPVFATGLQAISSYNVSHSSVNNDVQFRHSSGTPAVHQNPRTSKPIAANTSRPMTELPDNVRIQNNLSGLRLAQISPTDQSQKAITSNMQSISKCSTLPRSNVLGLHVGDNSNNASVHRASSLPMTFSRITPNQLSSIVSSLNISNNGLLACNPNLNQHLFVENADVRSTVNKPSIHPSQITSGVCRPNVSGISDDSPAPHQRGIFSKGSMNETNDVLKPVTPTSSLISHSSSAAHYPPYGMLQKPSASPSDGKFGNQQHPHKTSTVTTLRPGHDLLVLSHNQPNMSALIPSRSSTIVIGESDKISAACGNHHDKRQSHALGEKSVNTSHRSCIEADRHLLTSSRCQSNLCESYPSSVSNLAQSQCVTVANEALMALQLSSSQFAANFDFSTGFPQIGDSDENAFSSAGPHWVNTNDQDNNPSRRDQATFVRQSPGPSLRK